MNRQKVAQELIAIAEDLATAGEVPEAFKKQWKKNDKGKKDEGGKKEMPDFIKKKMEKKSSLRRRGAQDWPYAAVTFKKRHVSFRVSFGPNEQPRTGSEPYRPSVQSGIVRVFQLLNRMGVPKENVEVIA